jgi:hypothetical protein
MSIIFIITKYLAFLALSGVSMLLSYNMFSQLSTVPIESLLLSVVAIAIEALKIFSLVRGNTLNQLKLKTQALRAYGMYTVLAILAVLASYGYTLTVIDRGIRAADQSFVQFEIDANRSELEIVEEQITSLERQIEVAVTRQQNTPYDFLTAWRNITEQINQLEGQKAEFIARRLSLNREFAELRTELAREQTQTRSTVNMFRLMAESFGIGETLLMLILLLSIAILIELGIISTSPTIPIDRKHIVHILNEFAHNLHLDELEAERALEKAKRQQQIHKMYEDAGIQDPNIWPVVDRRHSESESSEPRPNDNLRKLMKDPLDPTLPDDTYDAAFTPEKPMMQPEQAEASPLMTYPVQEDISFFNALKTVLFKKALSQESDHHEDEEDGESLSHASSPVEPIEEVIQKDIPIRKIHKAELPVLSLPPQVEEAPIEETVPTTLIEETPPEEETLTANELDQIVATTDEVTYSAGTPEQPSEDVEVLSEQSAPSVEEPIVEAPKEELLVEKQPEPAPEPELPPKPVRRRRERVLPKKPEPEPEPEPTPTPVEEPKVENTVAEELQEAANWSSRTTAVTESPVAAASEAPTPTPPRSSVESDSVDELHVRSNKPQEVGETKTYRFGKTTPEVRKLFIAFIEGLFKENGEDFLVDPAVASREAKIKPALGTIFIKRLEDLKGSTGLSLVMQKEDGLYYPNYTKEYIISYTTKEVNTQGRAV